MLSAEEVPPPLAATALALTVPEWSQLGLDPDGVFDGMSEDELLDNLVKRATSLLLIRIVAVLVAADKNNTYFPDLSSITICRTVLVNEKPWSYYSPLLTTEFLTQLESYVRKILSDGYDHDTPYHNHKHAFHVVLSSHKLIDLMLQQKNDTNNNAPKTYGLRRDALAQFALVFAALIHDVEHKGVPNRQLVLENDPLAILYNDHSVAEQRSIYVGFHELLKPEYQSLRQTIFQATENETESENYRRFRKLVVGMVLHTDIASPERIQITKCKWKEAFGDTFESVERKLKHRLSLQQGAYNNDDDNTDEDGDDDVSCSDSATPGSSEAGLDEESDLAFLTGLDVGTKGATSHTDQTHCVASGMNNLDGHNGDGGNIISPGKQRTSSLQSMEESDRKAVLEFSSSVQESSTERNRLRRTLPGRPGIFLQKYAAKFQRRMSPYSSGQPARASFPFRKRLGIRRSMDLGGEEIETYARRGSAFSSLIGGGGLEENNTEDDLDDELKKTVVMETIMSAADVAPILQGWDQMLLWSSRLYLELRKAHLEGRGTDPQIKWFENQIGFLESYLLPLARRLEDAGVFGDAGQTFPSIVEANRDQWLEEGHEVTNKIIAHGLAVYNEETLAREKVKDRNSGRGDVDRSKTRSKFRASNFTVITTILLAILMKWVYLN